MKHDAQLKFVLMEKMDVIDTKTGKIQSTKTPLAVADAIFDVPLPTDIDTTNFQQQEHQQQQQVAKNSWVPLRFVSKARRDYQEEKSKMFLQQSGENSNKIDPATVFGPRLLVRWRTYFE